MMTPEQETKELARIRQLISDVIASAGTKLDIPDLDHLGTALVIVSRLTRTAEARRDDERKAA